MVVDHSNDRACIRFRISQRSLPFIDDPTGSPSAAMSKVPLSGRRLDAFRSRPQCMSVRLPPLRGAGGSGLLITNRPLLFQMERVAVPEV